jgi:TPP-dependent indolepyruvate ferredoxin oxidoreductase alpha subunit
MALDYIQAHELNEFFDSDLSDVGIILQGRMYSGVMRALMRSGLAGHLGRDAGTALRAERDLSAAELGDHSFL